MRQPPESRLAPARLGVDAGIRGTKFVAERVPAVNFLFSSHIPSSLRCAHRRGECSPACLSAVAKQEFK